MIYNRYQGEQVSALALGTMRLPVKDDKGVEIDEEKALEMFDYAFGHGVNYFDTAWGYHGGNSELVTGKALSRYPRDKFFLATKFPGYDVSNFGKVAEIFEKQLEKCRVDFFDFYLFHNVCETNIEHYLDDEKYGTYSYLIQQKRNGRIKHLGFSCHGTTETFGRFLERYGDDMEFCQLQLNYLDWEFQQGREKVEMLKKLGIPVIVMEPVRGGKLANIGDIYRKRLGELRPDASPVEWCFRFLQSLPEVTTTLSGMSSLDQLKENIEIYSEKKPLTSRETEALLGIGREMTGQTALPCTACRYCTEYCPQGLDIPTLIALYNEHAFSGGGFLAPMRLATLPEGKRPADCIGCRSCEAVCPQGILISEAFTDFVKRLS